MMVAPVQTGFPKKTNEDPIQDNKYSIPQNSALDRNAILINELVASLSYIQKKIEDVEKEFEPIRREMSAVVEPELHSIQIERAILSATQDETIQRISALLAKMNIPQKNDPYSILDSAKKESILSDIEKVKSSMNQICSRDEKLKARQTELKIRIEILEALSEGLIIKKLALQTRQQTTMARIAALRRR